MRSPCVAVVCMATWLAGCATPEYAIRQVPVPEESPSALQIERTISAYQAGQFQRQGARSIGPSERLAGFEVQPLVNRLSRVTERPSLRYRAYLLHDDDPNAAALADGRIYLTTGLLNYLARRGGQADELASVISHELAHTVAQHLVKRYRMLQQQELLMALVAAGAAVASRDAGAPMQRASRLAVNVASLLQDVANSGYSQEQELEADQLGIQYMIRAGFRPEATLELLQDFSRFEQPWPLLRTHPYSTRRQEDLQRYLTDIGYWERTQPRPQQSPSTSAQQRLTHLREIQRLYPSGSVSWQNLQRQIEALIK
ncbi:MAG: M48 family metallopeptidase [Candidatus Omnitrophota bacterium]|nr:M48 family metallopeptidase [Candidatus Omnitrophota bacterium]